MSIPELLERFVYSQLSFTTTDYLSYTHEIISSSGPAIAEDASCQIKHLETVLGVKLFDRGTRAVTLTEAGRTYLPFLQQAFDSISDGTRMLTRVTREDVLTVRLYSTFAVRWLVSRLHRFQERYPDLRVRLMRMAARGMGVALVMQPCVSEDLAAGLLACIGGVEEFAGKKDRAERRGDLGKDFPAMHILFRS